MHHPFHTPYNPAAVLSNTLRAFCCKPVLPVVLLEGSQPAGLTIGSISHAPACCSLICARVSARRSAYSWLDISASLSDFSAWMVDEASVVAALCRLSAIYSHLGCGALTCSIGVALIAAYRMHCCWHARPDNLHGKSFHERHGLLALAARMCWQISDLCPFLLLQGG